MQWHKKLKIIRNKRYLVALLKREDYRPINYEINKARRKGYKVRNFRVNDWINDIMKINLSTAYRQGKPMSEGYLHKDLFLKSHGGKNFLGIFQNGNLYAYCDIIRNGQILIINTILGHKERLRDGIMYLLFDRIIKYSTEWVYYDTFLGNSPGLQYFKRKIGFKPYNVIWKVKNK
jgi:hypothetical protein